MTIVVRAVKSARLVALVALLWLHMVDVTGGDVVVLVEEKQTEAETGTAAPNFGREMLQQEFLLNYTSFNHGSYGACPKKVLDFQNSLRLQQEQQPDPWMRVRYLQYINATRRKLAEYVQATTPEQAETLVLVESASTAVNSIMRSMQWKQGDIILYFDVAYGMVKNTAKWLQAEYSDSSSDSDSDDNGIQIVEVPVHFPISEETASSAFTVPLKQALDQLQAKHPLLEHLRLVVLDHIVSAPAVKEPIDELAQMIKNYAPHCFVLVDGAHAMGQVKTLNLSAMSNVDAYLSNGHKWLYSPKGSAFLWVNQSSVVNNLFPQPTVISSANPLGTSLSQRYSYVSSRDYTAFIAMQKAIDFRRYVGGEDAIYHYCRTLAVQAKGYLMDLWKVDAMAPNSMEEFMINILLPEAIHTQEMATELMNYLLREHQMYIRIAYHGPSGILYTRLSSQIYLEMDDFVKLGDLVLQFCSSIGQAKTVASEA
jgi:selenocysteine lyase/cysteine desulfurase